MTAKGTVEYILMLNQKNGIVHVEKANQKKAKKCPDYKAFPGLF